jgi:hypothetical protein
MHRSGTPGKGGPHRLRHGAGNLFRSMDATTFFGHRGDHDRAVPQLVEKTAFAGEKSPWHLAGDHKQGNGVGKRLPHGGENVREPRS